jgi:hypothetical protein
MKEMRKRMLEIKRMLSLYPIRSTIKPKIGEKTVTIINRIEINSAASS